MRRANAWQSSSNHPVGIALYFYIIPFVDKPSIEKIPQHFVNETEQIIITRAISSNPSSDVYWYIKADIISLQRSVTVASFTKENATCADTKNFTVVASNGIGNNDSVMVELIVNCECLLL